MSDEQRCELCAHKGEKFYPMQIGGMWIYECNAPKPKRYGLMPSGGDTPCEIMSGCGTNQTSVTPGIQCSASACRMALTCHARQRARSQ